MSTQRRTADEMALEIMLSDAPTRVREARLAKLLNLANASIGDHCPQCRCNDTESNGHSEYRCCACDHRWEPGA